MGETINDSGWRGSKDVWLSAAYEMLLESGAESVKVLPLAKRLKLSRTSFYWFFTDREEMMAALLERWRELNTGNLIRQTTLYAETITEAMLNVIDCWLDPALFDSRFEFAVRSWALQAPETLAAVQAADLDRLSALSAMFIRFGEDPARADVRARTVYLTQIGYISMQTHEDLATRLERIPRYVEIFTGAAPDTRDMARFLARHPV